MRLTVPPLVQRRGLVLVGLLGLAGAAWAGEGVYKWVDAEGRTHFGSQPPPGSKAHKLDIRPAVPDPVGPPAAASWQEQLRRSSELRHQRQQEEAEQAKKARVAEQECQAARRTLYTLGRERPVYRSNAQGEREYLEDDQRQAAIESARIRAETACR
jgi:hypothetical protein